MRSSVAPIRADGTPRLLRKNGPSEKDALGFREFFEQLARVGKRARLRIRNRKSFRGQLDRGRDQFGPRLSAVLLVRQFEAAHGARHARDAPAVDLIGGRFAGGVQVHVAAMPSSGRCSRKSMNVVRPSANRASRNPPPPMLPAQGYVTASANPTATAASIALPPAFSTATPTSVAMGSCATTMACRACTGWRAARGTATASRRRPARTRTV